MRRRALALTALLAAGLAVAAASSSSAHAGPLAPPAEGLEDNWGRTPGALRARFLEAELASEIPGLGRALAVWGWSIGRGKFVPNAHNQTAAEIKQSIAAFDRNPEWPQGWFSEEWRGGGSWGLFDILAGAHAHAGIHQGFAPLVEYPVSSLRRVDVQLYIVGWIVYRLVSGPYPVLVVDDPARTWANIRACAISPAGYLSGSEASRARVKAFGVWAKDLGIDLRRVAMPRTSGWPGAKVYFERLQVFSRPDDPAVLT